MPPFDALAIPWRSLQLTINSTPSIHHCEPAWSWAPPPLPDYDLWCVLGGSGRLQLEEIEHALRPGMCFLLTPGSRPKGRHDPSTPLIIFACHFDFVQGQRNSLSGIGSWKVHDRQFLQAMAEHITRCHRIGAPAGAAELAILQILLTALAALPGQNVPDERIMRCMEAVEREPGAEWPLEKLARLAGLSRAQVTRRFKAQTGLPPSQYVIRTRLNRAKGLLIESDLTVSQVADALGYRDPFFFSRQFRAIVGVPPGHYRRRRDDD